MRRLFPAYLKSWLTFFLLWPVLGALISCSEHRSNDKAPLSDGTGQESVLAAEQRPNIVLILADDLGYGDLGAYNENSKIPTPNIDALARKGVVFTQAHSPSAVCTPTRYGVLTGEYAWRTWLKKGVLEGYDRSLINPGQPTLGSLLSGRGYTTAAVGKWHLGFGSDGADFLVAPDIRPTTLGFDYFFGISSSLDIPPYGFIENGVFVMPLTESIEDKQAGPELDNFWYWREGPIAEDFDFYTVEQILMDKAIDFVSKQAGGDSPFFLYLPLTAPHTPLMPRPEFVGASDAGVYGDFVTQTDGTVGRLIDTLKETGQSDNTVIIMTSDNGAITFSYLEQHGHAANGELRGMKSQLFEGGHRIPLIVHAPDRFAPAVSDRFVSLVDLFSTFAELTGADVPQGAATDSISFANALSGVDDRNEGRDVIVSHSLFGTFAIQQGDWKLIMDDESGGFGDAERPEGGVFWYGSPLEHSRDQWQLYNLKSDPLEAENVLNQYPDVVDQLASRLSTIQIRQRD